MCCYCCISLRGAVYFGTSVHIFIGLILSLLWAFQVYVLSFETERLFVEAFVTIIAALVGAYLFLFVTLGCLIFRGVEKRSLTLLKWSATGFATLQVLVFTVILILYFVSPDGEWSYAQSETLPLEKQIMRVAIYFLSLVATANYIFVLILYIRKLWQPKIPHLSHSHNSHSKSESTSSSAGANNNLTTSTTTAAAATNPLQISSPIPQPMSHYYRRGLQGQGQGYGYGHGQQMEVAYPGMPYRRAQPLTPTPRYIQRHQNPALYESVLDSNNLTNSSRRNSVTSNSHLQQQQQQPFYPANFYSATVNPQNQSDIEAIYNQSQVSNTTTSFMHRYPYPHERYRFPLDSPRPQDHHYHGGETPNERVFKRTQSPQMEMQVQMQSQYEESLYGGSVRGRGERTPINGYDQSSEPLLRKPNNIMPNNNSSNNRDS